VDVEAVTAERPVTRRTVSAPAVRWAVHLIAILAIICTSYFMSVLDN
jgi:hypothetical protein